MFASGGVHVLAGVFHPRGKGKGKGKMGLSVHYFLCRGEVLCKPSLIDPAKMW